MPGAESPCRVEDGHIKLGWLDPEVARPTVRIVSLLIWLFALALYGLLQVFDGRYRDFPLGLFALPCIGYAVLALLQRAMPMPSLEQRFLAVAAPLLGVVIVVQECGQNVAAWLWLGLCLAIAVPVFAEWRRVCRLQS